MLQLNFVSVKMFNGFHLFLEPTFVYLNRKGANHGDSMSICESIVGSLPPATALHYHSNILWTLFLMSRSTLQAGSEMSGWTVYLALISSCVMVFLMWK